MGGTFTLTLGGNLLDNLHFSDILELTVGIDKGVYIVDQFPVDISRDLTLFAFCICFSLAGGIQTYVRSSHYA